MLELRHGDMVCARCERLLELRRWYLPGIHRGFKLRHMCSGDGIEFGWCIGIKHLRAVFGGFVLFHLYTIRVRCMRFREFHALHGVIELHGMCSG